MTTNNNNFKNTSTNNQKNKTSSYYDDTNLPDKRYYNKLPYVRSKSAERNEGLENNKEQPIRNHNYYPSGSHIYQLKEKSANMEMNEIPEGMTIKRHASLICRALNHDGEPVTVNEEVIKNRLILSCHPREYYTVGRKHRRPVVIEAEPFPKYTPPPQPQYANVVSQPHYVNTVPQPQYVNAVPLPQTIKAGPQTQYISPAPHTRYINAVPEAQYINPIQEIQYNEVAPHAHYLNEVPQPTDSFSQPAVQPRRPIQENKEKIQKTLDYQPTSERYPKIISRSITNVQDLDTLAKVERVALEEQTERYETKYKTVQCKRYARNFKTFLWALFFINLFLILVGFALLLLTMSHILFRDYISSVIRQTGFITWLWAVLVLAIVLIIFGLYGIITSITRNRTMLGTYCVVAAILALIILLYLLLFWVKVNSLKSLLEDSMRKTFTLYRCQGWARKAWDDLQDKYQCCGIDFRTDWKYIPPSCCQADTSTQKLGCVGHFISMDQAYKYGCRSMLEAYFLNIFLLITCLLILAFTLLILGIIAAYRLMRMYKIIMLCRETYYISS